MGVVGGCESVWVGVGTAAARDAMSQCVDNTLEENWHIFVTGWEEELQGRRLEDLY